MVSIHHTCILADTAEREVFEETGITAGKFIEHLLVEWLIPFIETQSIIAFRQHHHLSIAFGQSDLYFICRMKPFTYTIRPCTSEILHCQWMSIRELHVSPLATILTNRIAAMMLRGAKNSFRELDIKWEDLPSPAHSNQKYRLFGKRTEY